jgi:hypothetical protein
LNSQVIANCRHRVTRFILSYLILELVTYHHGRSWCAHSLHLSYDGDSNINVRHRYHIRRACIRNMHSPWEHLHRSRSRGRLHHGLHVNRKWKDPCHREHWCVALYLLGMPYLTVANSEQIRKYWGAYKPNLSLEMFQTPPGSIIIPGIAGMTL